MKIPPVKTIEILLKANKIEYEKNYQFYRLRKWKADFHLPELGILIEYEGGTWWFKDENNEKIVGRHLRGDGYSKDCQKYNKAQVIGFAVLRYTADMINNNPQQVIDDINEIRN